MRIIRKGSNSMAGSGCAKAFCALGWWISCLCIQGASSDKPKSNLCVIVDCRPERGSSAVSSGQVYDPKRQATLQNINALVSGRVKPHLYPQPENQRREPRPDCLGCHIAPDAIAKLTLLQSRDHRKNLCVTEVNARSLQAVRAVNLQASCAFVYRRNWNGQAVTTARLDLADANEWKPWKMIWLEGRAHVAVGFPSRCLTLTISSSLSPPILATSVATP